MNKLIIPLVLLAVVAIAAGYAFSPVQEVTTVHSSILDAICVTTQNGNTPGATWDGTRCTNLDE